jgi:hypothetical protein
VHRRTDCGGHRRRVYGNILLWASLAIAVCLVYRFCYLRSMKFIIINIIQRAAIIAFYGDDYCILWRRLLHFTPGIIAYDESHYRISATLKSGFKNRRIRFRALQNPVSRIVYPME